MRYTTGEMAEFFGMTKEGIRFLERKGMITAQRDANNGYRYFAQPEISLLKHLRSYCSMGFSLEEAHRLICNTPQDEVVARLDEKLSELSKKEEQLQRMKTMLTQQRKAAQWALEIGQAFELCQSPDLLLLLRKKGNRSIGDRKPERAWIQAMPPVMMVAEYDEEGRCRKGSAVRTEDAAALNLPVSEEVTRCLPMQCVHGVMDAPLMEMPDLSVMRAWAQERGLVQCAPAICLVQLTYLHGEGRRWTIHEIYLPVCEKTK